VLVAGEETGEGLSTWRRAAAAHQSSESETGDDRETDRNGVNREGRRTAGCSAQGQRTGSSPRLLVVGRYFSHISFAISFFIYLSLFIFYFSRFHIFISKQWQYQW
jgi:hypothetical protein